MCTIVNVWVNDVDCCLANSHTEHQLAGSNLRSVISDQFRILDLYTNDGLKKV